MRDSLWLATLLLGDAVRSRRSLSRAYRLLEVERARSDGLLRNMLPEAIAGRLKHGRRSSAGGGSATTCGATRSTPPVGWKQPGSPGCIQVTERTRDLLGDRCLFQERGMIQVKGKGKMLTYFLSGRTRKHDHMLNLTEPH